MTVVRRRLAVRLRSRWSLARSALMTGYSTCMYSLVPVCVVCQQSWLANSSWRPAHSSDNVLFGDASHCSLMTDSGSYTYFSHCYHLFIAPYGCTAQYLVKKQMLYFSFYINLFCCKQLHSK